MAAALLCAPAAFAQRPVPGIPFIIEAGVTQSPPGDVTLHLRGYFPDTTCWIIEEGSEPFSLTMTHLLGEDCPDTLTSTIWEWHFALGQLAPGHHQVLLKVGVIEGVFSTFYQGVFAFDIPVVPVPALPYVTEIRIEAASPPPLPISPEDSIRVTVRGVFPNACYSVTGFTQSAEPIVPPPINMTVERGGCLDCPEVLTPFEASLVYPPLPAGQYQQVIRMLETDCAVPDTIVARHDVSIPFVVGADSVRYLSRIIVTPAGRREGPICMTDSIRVRFEGEFPDACGSLEGIEVDLVGVYPPQFRVILDRTNCQKACALVPTPWHGEVVMPPLPFGHFILPVRVIVTDCTPDNIVTVQPTTAEFDVLADCPVLVPGCFLPGFWARDQWCDATLGSDGKATLDFTIVTSGPIAGLQGAFVLDPPGLEILALEPIGQATGMRLAWRKTTNGARFALFSENGSSFGPCPAPPPEIYDCDARVLRITVRATSNAPPTLTYLRPTELLGSDPDGNAIYPCPTMRFAEIAARICAETACDVNHDAHADIRDLVLMVRCLMPVNHRDPFEPCPFYDCNRDSMNSLEDVLCCARRILNGGPCIDCPPDSTRPRPAPVHVSFGAPVQSEDRVVVPVRLMGSEHLGGARIDLAFPSDRYEVEDFSLAGGQSNWLSLHEVRGNRVVAGVIRISPLMTADVNQKLELLLTLRLKPGQTPGGEVRSAGGEFSGNDGALLQVPLALVQPLAAPARLALSEGRPNPFTNETVFSITLDQAADVTVGIYDLGGRLVATPQRGRLAAGSHPVLWNGRDASGETLPNGVYFALAVSGEAKASRKVVLLRGN